MKKKITWKEKLRYRFDNIMSKGTASLVILLFLITMVVVTAAGIISAIIDGTPGLSVLRSVWVSLMHAIDAGTLAGDEGNVAFIILMSIVTVCGIFITSMLIGIINSGIEGKMASLRKGKSQVLESGHVVILGFHEGTFTILSELIEANANQSKGVIVVMDDQDKSEMEDAIAQRITDTKTTDIICRSGKYTNFSDLEICSLDMCQSIIVQSEDDFSTIKAILALTCLLKKYNNKDAYIVAVIQNPENVDTATIAGEGYAEIVYFEDTISRIMAHICRQPGISNVFTELFDYGGDEIYVEKIEDIVGKRMGELHLYFENSTVLGIQKEGHSFLNPPPETIVEKDDRLILLAEDDQVSIPLSNPAVEKKDAWMLEPQSEEKPQHILILGCNKFLKGILLEEDQYVVKGSIVTVAAHSDDFSETMLPDENELQNITVDIKLCNLYNKAELLKIITNDIQSILILSSQNDSSEDADAKMLMLLLKLREITQQMGRRITVASEMQNAENQKLAQITGVNDFVISSNLTSLMLTQISQTRELKAIFEELLIPEGSEIYMKPVENYIQTSREIDLFTVAGSVATKGEVFMGYRKTDMDTQEFSIVLNPKKTETVTFQSADYLIVLAED